MYVMKSFQAATDSSTNKQKHIHESENHSSGKALPALQMDLSFEQRRQEGTFISSQMGCEEWNSQIQCSAPSVGICIWDGHLHRLWQIYMKSNPQKLGDK